ncbi:MAG TPA: GNAT family N-acetyltransferase [Candidatus Saccharimonadales bacterium]
MSELDLTYCSFGPNSRPDYELQARTLIAADLWQLTPPDPFSSWVGQCVPKKEGDLYCALLEDEKMVAVGTLFPALWERPMDFYLLNILVVASEYRKKNIGSRMLALVEKEAHSLGAAGVKLKALDSSKGFFLRHNYEPFEYRKEGRPRTLYIKEFSE